MSVEIMLPGTWCLGVIFFFFINVHNGNHSTLPDPAAPPKKPPRPGAPGHLGSLSSLSSPGDSYNEGVKVGTSACAACRWYLCHRMVGDGAERTREVPQESMSLVLNPLRVEKVLHELIFSQCDRF